jgi:hypothetical protein
MPCFIPVPPSMMLISTLYTFFLSLLSLHHQLLMLRDFHGVLVPVKTVLYIPMKFTRRN